MSEEKCKPVLDEQSLANLLEAAYVLQEHNREREEIERALELKRSQLEAEERSRAAQQPPQAHNTEQPGSTDYTFTLAKIVDTQHQIQIRQLDLDSALAIVAERLVEIARAQGAAIGILSGKTLRYQAVAGTLTLRAGTDVPMEKALCLASLRTGQVFSSADIGPEFLIDPEECRRRGIQSLIAVPVFHDGAVAGGVELYYPTPHAFTEHDVHSCQLMAGLVSEALARDEEVTSKKSLVNERAAMLEALEALKPNLTALVDKSSAKNSGARTVAPAPAASAPTSTFECRQCQHKLVGEEQFCGNCGAPRGSYDEATSLQTTVAALWHTQEAIKDSSPPDRAISASAQGSLAFPDRFPSEQSLKLPKSLVTGHRNAPKQRNRSVLSSKTPCCQILKHLLLKYLRRTAQRRRGAASRHQSRNRSPSQSQNAPRPGVPPRAPEHSWNSWPHRNARDLWSAGYGTLGAAIFIWRSLYFW